MKIEYDPVKNKSNLTKHGLSFDETIDFDWGGAEYQKVSATIKFDISGLVI